MYEVLAWSYERDTKPYERNIRTKERNVYRRFYKHLTIYPNILRVPAIVSRVFIECSPGCRFIWIRKQAIRGKNFASELRGGTEIIQEWLVFCNTCSTLLFTFTQQNLVFWKFTFICNFSILKKLKFVYLLTIFIQGIYKT